MSKAARYVEFPLTRPVGQGAERELRKGNTFLGLSQHVREAAWVMTNIPSRLAKSNSWSSGWCPSVCRQRLLLIPGMGSRWGVSKRQATCAIDMRKAKPVSAFKLVGLVISEENRSLVVCVPSLTKHYHPPSLTVTENKVSHRNNWLHPVVCAEQFLSCNKMSPPSPLPTPHICSRGFHNPPQQIWSQSKEEEREWEFCWAHGSHCMCSVT